MIELSLEARPENLHIVLGIVRSELDRTGCAGKLRKQIIIATEEIFVNIAHYAYSPDVGGVTIRISVGEEIVIEFEDSGKPFNPLEAERPNINACLEEREIGGLGVFIVKKITDSIEYARLDNKNILLIRKRLLFDS